MLLDASKAIERTVVAVAGKPDVLFVQTPPNVAEMCEIPLKVPANNSPAALKDREATFKLLKLVPKDCQVVPLHL